MSRVSDLQLEFKDSRFHITGISEPKDDFSGSGSVGGLPPVPGVGPITPAPGQSSSEFGSTPQVPTPSTAPQLNVEAQNSMQSAARGTNNEQEANKEK